LFLQALRLVLAGLLFIIGLPLVAWAAGPSTLICRLQRRCAMLRRSAGALLAAVLALFAVLAEES
jgi:hypothetical protein